MSVEDDVVAESPFGSAACSAGRRGEAGGARHPLSSYWKHLRLPFQLTLAPLFLWGAFLAGEGWRLDLVTAFIALHFCLYPGITAFNSAYDLDEGPVSGMLHPPEVPPGLLLFSVALQLAGALMAAFVGPWLVAIYLSIALLAAAYSHPRIRWKADPLKSAATVAIGQGVLGFLAGWCAASGTMPEPGDVRALLGGLVAGLTTLGLYPATQVFQVEEDEVRGDRTLAVALGPSGALRLGSASLAGAGMAATWLMAQTGKPAGVILIAAAYLGILVHNELFARRIGANKLDVTGSYRWAMRTSFMSAAGFLLFIVVQISAA